ncbi:hypothetical protein PoB_004962600 [Plakobranchus ocellatus]|uniref:Uncharacterized protein n=1 Tax=Plakobranchus ocellatus TaxID=259542 RepID=A0AAV4BRL5_9GAST|nr:hypothetical protein PoB_004962600 [Plakobranchus ocellatus]
MKTWACTCTVVCRMFIALNSECVNSKVITPDGLSLHSDVIVLIATFCAAKAQIINELHIKGWDNLQADFESKIPGSKTLVELQRLLRQCLRMYWLFRACLAMTFT